MKRFIILLGLLTLTMAYAVPAHHPIVQQAINTFYLNYLEAIGVTPIEPHMQPHERAIREGAARAAISDGRILLGAGISQLTLPTERGPMPIDVQEIVDYLNRILRSRL